MKATILYKQLEKDFITKELSDSWAKHMAPIKEFLSDNFKKRSMGVVCDFAQEIKKVYTAVFPSKCVMKEVLSKKETDIMLFIHHPMIWNIRTAPKIFHNMDKKLLQKFKDKRIAIYNLHVPLDNYVKYSTSLTLAKALSIKTKKAFAPYFGALAGVFGDTKLRTVQELKKKFERAVGHKVKLYKNGGNEIKDGSVALIAGGGNDIDMLKEIAEAGVNTFVTGVTIKNDHSKKAHNYSKKNRINVLGGTHYSTEKFACIAMIDYFKKLGLPSEFIKDKPIMQDI